MEDLRVVTDFRGRIVATTSLPLYAATADRFRPLRILGRNHMRTHRRLYLLEHVQRFANCIGRFAQLVVMKPATAERDVFRNLGNGWQIQVDPNLPLQRDSLSARQSVQDYKPPFFGRSVAGRQRSCVFRSVRSAADTGLY